MEIDLDKLKLKKDHWKMIDKCIPINYAGMNIHRKDQLVFWVDLHIKMLEGDINRYKKLKGILENIGKIPYQKKENV